MPKRNTSDHSSSQIPIIWLKPIKSPRELPLLTREKIIHAAIHILDEAGLNGLTIRKLAQQLNVGPTSLYNHIETRDDVLELALDSIIGEVAFSNKNLAVEQALTDFLIEWRRVLLKHIWSISLLGFKPLIGPNALAHAEHLRSILVRTDLSISSIIYFEYTLSNFLIGSVVSQVSWQTGNEQEIRNQVASFITLNAETYPLLAAHAGNVHDDWDQSFIYGLQGIIRCLIKQ